MILACAAILSISHIDAPVKLELVMDKPSYAAGEEVEANLVLKNVSKKTLAVAMAPFDGGMAAGAGVMITFNGKPIEVTGGTSSRPLAQVMVNNEVTSDRFRELQPSQYVNVYWIKFKAQAIADRPASHLKSEMAKRRITVKPLSSGEYQVKGYYTYGKSTKTGVGGPFDAYEFTPSAKRLFDMSFSGSLTATGKFSVLPAAKVSLATSASTKH